MPLLFGETGHTGGPTPSGGETVVPCHAGSCAGRRGGRDQWTRTDDLCLIERPGSAAPAGAVLLEPDSKITPQDEQRRTSVGRASPISGSIGRGREGRAGRSSTCRCGWCGRDARRVAGDVHRSGPSPGGAHGSPRPWRARTRIRRVDFDRSGRTRGTVLERGSRVRRWPALPVRCRRLTCACSMSWSISTRRRR